MKKVAVLQSNYIPWKGVFDIIHDVDLFVFYDEVQYVPRSWQNRNLIRVPNGTQWLTVPVCSERTSAIEEVTIADSKWSAKHFNAICTNYGKAPYFEQYKSFLEYIYLEKKWGTLSELNQFLLMEISKILGIKTEFRNSREFKSTGAKHEKLLSLLKEIGADYYLSGPAAKDYILVEDYEKAGIELVWKSYDGYPAYRQRYDPYISAVSILDLLFNTGNDAPYYIWGWREDATTDKLE